MRRDAGQKCLIIYFNFEFHNCYPHTPLIPGLPFPFLEITDANRLDSNPPIKVGKVGHVTLSTNHRTEFFYQTVTSNMAALYGRRKL